jgi:predicted Zn finger-like uncharacterized protein
MQITCPACSTNYRLPDNAIGAEGKTVRCAKCKHRWFQTPAKDFIEEEEPEFSNLSATIPQPSLGNLPVTHSADEKTSTARVANFMVIMVGVICALFLLFVGGEIFRHKVNALDKILLALSFANTKEIILRDMENKIVEVDGGRDFMLKGSLLNKSKEEQELPALRVEFRDADYGLLKTINLDAGNKKLLPEEKLAFENRFSNIPADTTTIIIDAASAGELFFR